MEQNPKIRHDVLLREKAAILFEEGRGAWSIAKALSLPLGTVRSWSYVYAVLGRKGLVSMDSNNRSYTFEQKLSIVKAIVDEKKPAVEVMAAHGIGSRTTVGTWCRAYREGGEDALKPKKNRHSSGRKNKPENARELELEVRVRKLEAENAYLKKLAALRVEETLRTGKKPQW